MQADPLAAAISGLSFEPLTQLSAFFHSTPVMVFSFLTLLVLAYFTLKDKRKLVLIVMTVALAVVVSESVKPYYASERPCSLLSSKVPCPSDYSFPSGHAIVAFALMAAMLGEPLFPLCFLFALFIAFSRLYLGVHTSVDVAASLALAFASYALASAAYRYASGGKKG